MTIDYGLDLSPQHAELLAASAISVEVAQARGYRTVRTKGELRTLGFAPSQCHVPALLVPVWGVTKQVVTHQLRPDQPRKKKGKPLKYETPAGSRMALDVPPPAFAYLGDPTRPLLITEGARKADAAVSFGLCCVAVLGVWNFRGTNEHGGKVALGDWDSVAVNGRDVYIAFDSDVTTKPEVQDALRRLKVFVESRGARVRVIDLPPGPGGQKTGLDDYFARGGSIPSLFALATTKIPEAPSATYELTSHGIVWHKLSVDGASKSRLTNFGARIVEDVMEDDGAAEPRHILVVEAVLNGRPPQLVRLPPASFHAMTWPIEHLGPSAIVYPGINQRSHAGVAIQVLSGERIPERRVYTHSGWRALPDGQHVYLHAGGAIGASGEMPGIAVALPGPLCHLKLPAPPSGAELQAAVRASLEFLDVAPPRVTVPLLAAVMSPVLSEPDYSVHLVGATGRRKTELAACAQRHYGTELTARRLPTWNSTANFLEALLFAAKDALVVIDDFAPSGTGEDIKRMHRDVIRVFRAQGNRAGRGRMAADTSLRPEHPPRGLLLSTGEDIPRVQSAQARVFIVEIGETDVDLKALTQCQQDAAAGRYAGALAAFIRWVASRYEEERAAFRAAIDAARRTATPGLHGRTVDMVAALLYSLGRFLAFAAEVGVLTVENVGQLEGTARKVLDETAAEQAAHHATSEPTTRFLELLRAAITSGHAHLASPGGGAPPIAYAYGWRARMVGAGEHEHVEWQPQGELIGWVEDADLYLEPTASYNAAQREAREGEPLSISVKTLGKRLEERDLLVTAERDDGRQTIRVRNLQGARRRVLHLRTESVVSHESGPSGPSGPAAHD